MIPTWRHIFIAALLAFISSEIVGIFMDSITASVVGFAVGVLYLLSLNGKMPIIPIGVNHEVQLKET